MAAPTEVTRAGGSTPRSASAYRRLHELGWAHSIETWQGDELVGGLYGVSVGGLFAGESMFYRVSDASKVALVTAGGRAGGRRSARLLDVQWVTGHLASLGAVEVPRAEYRRRLAPALRAATSCGLAGGRRQGRDPRGG